MRLLHRIDLMLSRLSSHSTQVSYDRCAWQQRQFSSDSGSACVLSEQLIARHTMQGRLGSLRLCFLRAACLLFVQRRLRRCGQRLKRHVIASGCLLQLATGHASFRACSLHWRMPASTLEALQREVYTI